MSRKLNFGCGSNRLDGWENFDAEVDIRNPLPFPNESAIFILAEHVVEHVTAPEALRFFEECYRVLEKGGVLRVCVPGIQVQALGLRKCRDLIVGHGHQTAFNSRLLVDMLSIAGFLLVYRVVREPMDGHWKVIGLEQDNLETIRLEAKKL